MKEQKKLYEKQLEKDHEFMVKNHYRMQSKSTLDMMKRSKKMSKGLNLKRKKPFLRSLKKCKKPVDSDYVEDK